MSYCGTCGQQLRQGKKFCSHDRTPKGKGRTFCNYCGAQLKPNAKFCGKCRYEIESDRVPKLLSSPAHPPVQNTNPGKCTNCNTQNNAGVRSCSVCGKPLKFPLVLAVTNQEQQQVQRSPTKPVASRPSQSASPIPDIQNRRQNNSVPSATQSSPVKPSNPVQAKPVTIVSPKQPTPIKQPNSVKQPVTSTVTNTGGEKDQKAKRYSSIVDSKGRATIPKLVREFLGVEPGGTVVFTIEGGKVSFTASKSKKVGKNAS